jgi:hypothetical protein
MKKRKKLGLGAVTGAALLGITPAAPGATIVNLGALGTFNGPSQLDLTGTFPYAIDFNDSQNRSVNGLTFLTDTNPIPGATLTGPQNVVNWQTTPTFGNSADEDSLEEIMSDIRWASTGAPTPEFLQADLAVTQGQAYKLQVLFNGNHQEDRRWDILTEGALAVDAVTSLGPQPATYDPNLGIVYTYSFIAADSTFSVVFDGRNGAGTGNANGGNDGNPIWQALTLEAVPEPSSCTLLILGSLAFVRRLRKRGEA